MRQAIFSVLFVLVAVQNSQSQQADLSTPVAAYNSCVAAFKSRNTSVLQRCFKESPTAQAVELWRMALEACGGYERKVLGVSDSPPGGIMGPGGVRVTPPPDTVWIQLEPAGGCQSTSKMTKMDGEWRWTER